MFDFDSDDFDHLFKDSESRHRKHHEDDWVDTMSSLTAILCGMGALILICCLLACCCKRRRSRGQILSPPTIPPVPPGPNVPPPPGPGVSPAPVPAPYPQQQYAPYPVAVSAYPVAGVQGYPYPSGPAAPYPPAPYPSAGPGYPHPQPAVAYPTAPADPSAMPPSYEQAVTLGEKHPPYNPNAPR